jgi:hypothetical protein
MRYVGARVLTWVEAELPEAMVKPGAGVVPDTCVAAATVCTIFVAMRAALAEEVIVERSSW